MLSHRDLRANPDTVPRLNPILLIKAKRRYAGINLDKDNPQREALSQVIEELKAAKQKSIVFYATENPDAITSLVDPDQHERNLLLLDTLIDADYIKSADLISIKPHDDRVPPLLGRRFGNPDPQQQG